MTGKDTEERATLSNTVSAGSTLESFHFSLEHRELHSAIELNDQQLPKPVPQTGQKRCQLRQLLGAHEILLPPLSLRRR